MTKDFLTSQCGLNFTKLGENFSLFNLSMTILLTAKYAILRLLQSPGKILHLPSAKNGMA